MPDRITRLEGPLVDQIAAGEVVERPASVAKELVENAVDAGARAIAVELVDGGKTLLRVVDDGCGMSPRDAALALERHATSKIRTVEDLARIATLGFRGEALPSIASVSRLTLVTRQDGDDAGTRLVVDGGVVVERGAVGAQVGTSITVETLFANVPARLKFLKSRATEAGAVHEVVFRAVLAHPHLRASVSSEGRRVHDYPAVADAAARAAQLFPDDALRPISARGDGFELEAFLAAPERARSGTRQLHVLVNGRPVYDLKLARAVGFAFGSVIPPGRYPTGVVHLRVPLDEVDVNAHPQKAEVRFSRGAGLLEGITRALARSLGQRAYGAADARPKDYWDHRLGHRPAAEPRSGAAESPAAAAGVDAFLAALGGRTPAASEPPDHLGGPATASASRTMSAAVPAAMPTPAEASTRAATPATAPRSAPAAAPTSMPAVDHAPARLPLALPSLRFLGQVRKTFLVCEGPDGLVVLDQHAADERVVYHRLRTAQRDRAFTAQRLLFPERIEVTSDQAEWVDRAQQELTHFGLECTRLGPTTVAVHTVPTLLRRIPPATLLADVVAEGQRDGDRAFSDALDTAIATLACHGAIRAGDPVAPEEAHALLRALDAVDEFPTHCPHGRPVLLTLPFSDLEKRLGR